MADAFERQVKLMELKIKLIEVVGKWNLDMAKAERERAEAASIEIKNAILKRIENQLKIAMRELNRHKRTAETERAQAETARGNLAPLKTGTKPDATAASKAWNAFDWFLNFVPASDVGKFYETPIGELARSKDNFASVRTGDQPQAAPEDVNNLGLLIGWLRERRLWAKKAKPAHLQFLAGLGTIEAALDAVVTQYQTRLDAAQGQTYKELGQLRVFLGLPVSVEKTPTLPP